MSRIPPFAQVGLFFILLLVVSLTFISLRRDDPTPSSDPLPNLILIVADDLGAYDLGCYGNTAIETPRLDRLAAEGIRFTQAYAAAPVCSPSRAAIATGLHPARMALTEHIRGFPPPDPCWPLIPPRSMQRLPFAYANLAEVMEEADYLTAYVGKWHLGGGNYAPGNQGYDVSYAAGGQGLPGSFYPPYFGGNPFPELSTIAGDDDYLADALTTLAISTLPNDDTPFFLHLNFYAPHVPIEGPADLVSKYETKLGSDPDTLPRPEYAAMVEAIDRQVGRLIDTLANRGLLGNTILLFTSDHGALTVEEPGFDHTPPTTSGPLRGGKGQVFEGGLRVPLIAYGPGRFSPAVDSLPNMNTDYLSTLAHLIGLPRTTLDGQPIPALTGIAPAARDLYWHYPHYSNQQGVPAGVIRSGDFKLIDWYTPGDTVYLFNLKEDPSETVNLAADMPEMVNQLMQKFDIWRDTTGARPMAVNPAYDEDDCP